MKWHPTALRAMMAAGIMTVPVSMIWSQSARAKRQELRDVQKQLEQKKREIAEYEMQTEQLSHDLSSLASRTSESRRKLQSLAAKIRETEAKKAELKERLGALQLAENQWQNVLTEEVNGYFNHSLDQWDYFNYKDLWTESFRRAAILEKAHYVGGLHGFKQKTEVAQEQVLQQKNQLQSTTNQVRAEHRTRETLYRLKKEVYLETEQKVTQTRAQIQELKDSAVALTHLVRALERKSPYKAKGPPVPLAEPSHSLPWPVEGQLLTPFGKQQVPELHAWIVNQGIRVAAAAGAPVHPVKAGKVIFSGSFRSYGQVIILDHGQEFYTIYGMLGDMLKKKGDMVYPSDVLGTAGHAPRQQLRDDPSSEASARAPQGGIVYFEIRQSGDALDPVVWLQRR